MNAYITLFKSMLEISLLSSVMIAAVFAIKAIFKNKINVKTVTLLWLLVILRLCLPVMVESPFHIDSLLPAKPPASEEKAPYTQAAQEAPYYDREAPFYEETAMTPAAGTEGASTVYDEKPEGTSFIGNMINALDLTDLWGMASIAWLAGAVVVLLVSVEKSIAFSLYAKKNGREITDKKFLVSLDILKTKCNIKQSVKISACRLINMPVVYGIIRPHILLPCSMADKLKREHMDAIILHELCHIKNRDIIKNYAFLLGKALHWFNPLVWLAQKAIREDTELLCDQKVLAIIGDRHKGLYSQSLLEATRFVIERKTPMLTISLCENKSNLKERIMQMLKPQKKLKSAGIISVLTAIIMIIGCFTTACQSAPDVTIDYKDTANLSAAAQAGETTPPEENIPSAEPEADFTQYEAPETFTKTYEKDSLLITVDAQVEVPDVKKIYSVLFEHRNLTQELADTFLNYFIGDAPIYIRNDSETKASTLEKEIATWKQTKENAENNWDEVKDRDPYQGNGGQQGAIDYIQDVIDRLERQLETAPKEYGYSLGSRMLAPPADDGGKDIPPDATQEQIAAAKAEDERVAREQASMLQLMAYAKMEKSDIDDKMAYIYISSGLGKTAKLSFDNANEANENGYMIRREEMDELCKTISFSLDDAVAMAQEALRDMGIDNMYFANYNYNVLVKDGQLTPCYYLMFNQSLYGMPILHLSNGVSRINVSRPKTSEEWANMGEPQTAGVLESALSGQISDSMYVTVNESGVVRVSWDVALQQMDIIGECNDLLSFEDIVSIFEENIGKIYASDTDLEMVITKISLSMLPVSSDEGGEIIAVPVWDFRGYGYAPNDMEEKERFMEFYPDNISVMTINAIDGSLINR